MDSTKMQNEICNNNNKSDESWIWNFLLIITFMLGYFIFSRFNTGNKHAKIRKVAKMNNFEDVETENEYQVS
jgi:hypothetical protein